MAESYDVIRDPLSVLWGSRVWMLTLQFAPLIPHLIMRSLVKVNRFWIFILALWFGKPYTATKHIGPLYI